MVSSISYTLGLNVENLNLNSAGSVNGTGNTLGQPHRWRDRRQRPGQQYGNDWLIGYELDDTLIGGAGDDKLDGGNDNDVMNGGIGNDTYYVGSSASVINEAAAQGTDTVIASTSFSLLSIANVENLTLTGTADFIATGNALSNFLQGNDGKNLLFGNEGNDTLNGGIGIDKLTGGTGRTTSISLVPTAIPSSRRPTRASTRSVPNRTSACSRGPPTSNG